MNGKQARKLRQQAKEEANVEELTVKYNFKEHKVMVDGGFDESGQRKLIPCITNVATLDEDCGKAKYKQLKKQYKEQ